MARTKIINDIRRYLVDENIYTEKDEMSVLLLEIVYTQWINACKEVKKSGQTIQQVDRSGVLRTMQNPAFRIQMELLKQLTKLIDSLYLTPKSRKSSKIEHSDDKENPFKKMMMEISKVETRK